jgi:AAA15 family ATPase/GTPase
MKSLPKNYSIKNFKAFGDKNNQVPLRPITLVFGPNSAGKSSLLHSIIWLNEALRSKSFDFRYPELTDKAVDLGYFSQMIHGHDLSKRITVEMTFSADQFGNTINSFFDFADGIKVSFTIGKRFSANISEPTLLDCRLESISGEVFLSLIRRTNFHLDISNLDSLHPFLSHHDPFMRSYEIAKIFTPHYSAQLKGVISDEVSNIFPDNFEHYNPAPHATKETLTNDYGIDSFWEKSLPEALGNLFSEINELLLKSIGGMEYVPPLRELPPRYFNYVDSDQLWTRVFEHPEVSQKVNAWLNGSHSGGVHQQKKSGYELILSTFYSTTLLEREMPQYAHQQMARAFLDERSKKSDILNQIDVLYDQLKDKFLETAESYLSFHQDIRSSIIQEELSKNLDEYQKMLDDGFGWELEDAVSPQIIEEKYLTRELLHEESSYVVELYRRWLPEQEEVIDVMNQYSSAQESAHKQLNRIYSGTFYVEAYISSEYVRREIQLRDLRSNVRVSLQDLGVGVSQVLPVILQAYGTKNKLVAIEQPEIHLHPRLQSDLADVFIESALGENQNTFLLETHSEHLILRLLRRIRETTENDFSDWPVELKKACPNGIRPEDVAVLYVEPGEEGAQVRNLRINELGEFIDEWPNGFFEERIREIF